MTNSNQVEIWGKDSTIGAKTPSDEPAELIQHLASQVCHPRNLNVVMSSIVVHRFNFLHV